MLLLWWITKGCIDLKSKFLFHQRNLLITWISYSRRSIHDFTLEFCDEEQKKTKSGNGVCTGGQKVMIIVTYVRKK